MRLLLSAVLFLLLSSSVFAQTHPLRGTVLDSVTQRPVQFASVGVPGRPFGTIADEAGRFRFLLPDSVRRPVVVSCVGYAAATVPADRLRTEGVLIRLQPAAQQLAAVTVRPGKVRTRTVGRTGSATFMTARLYTEPGDGQDELAREQGTILRLPPNTYLRTARLLVAFNRFRAVTFRLLLYRVRHGQPAEPLPQPDIRFTVTQPRGWISLDLTPYHLYYPDLREVALTVQWLRSEAAPDSAKGFAFSAVPLPGHQVLTRSKSQARWEATPGYLGFNLTADTYATAGKAPAAGATPPEPDGTATNYALPDSLAFLRYMTQPYLPNPAHYGSNPAAGRFVRVRGARLYYERYGRGQPLLLLHGNGQSMASFQLQIAELARYFDVLVLDTRGQGQSQDFTTQDYRYELFAEDTRQLLDSLHLRRVHVLGWSDGGNTALCLALAHPEYVSRLAIMGANLFPAPDALEPTLLAGFQRQLQRAQARNPTATDTRLLRLLVQEPQLRFDQLSSLAAPVLVLAGQHDVVLEAHTRALARALPRSQLVIFPGATHFAPQEIPAVFNETILRFFRQP